jgi:hypothetical protein
MDYDAILDKGNWPFKLELELWVVFMVVFLTLFSFKVLRLCLVPPDVFVTCCPLYPSTICAKYGQIYKDQYLTRIIL